MNELMVELLMSENKALRDEITKLKARLYDAEHPETADTHTLIDWKRLLNDSYGDNMAEGVTDNV